MASIMKRTLVLLACAVALTQGFKDEVKGQPDHQEMSPSAEAFPHVKLTRDKGGLGEISPDILDKIQNRLGGQAKVISLTSVTAESKVDPKPAGEDRHSQNETNDVSATTESSYTEIEKEARTRDFVETGQYNATVLSVTTEYPNSTGDRDGLFPNTTEGCPMFYIPCFDGTCVHFTEFCDQVQNCPDGSDEDPFYCQEGVAVVVCNNGQLLRGHNVRCNGYPDCDDGSDEFSCDLEKDLNKIFLKPCSWPFKFNCNDGTCIGSAEVCDGIIDCPSAADESAHQCARKKKPTAQGKKFVCDNGEVVVSTAEIVCNNAMDCSDGSDEKRCPQTRLYKCADGTFIETDQHIQCNGAWDCLDGSDENGCQYTEEGAVTFRDTQKSESSTHSTVLIYVTALLACCVVLLLIVSVALCRRNTSLRMAAIRSEKKRTIVLEHASRPPSYSEVVGSNSNC